MFSQKNPLTSTETVHDLFSELERQGTPFRLEDKTNTYYILSAEQLIALFQKLPDQIEGDSFPLQDFGLTEADLEAYKARRSQRRKYINADSQTPLNRRLEKQLGNMGQIQQPISKIQLQEREKLLKELEEAMLENLQTAIQIQSTRDA